jgi:hypothetical protein
LKTKNIEMEKAIQDEIKESVVEIPEIKTKLFDLIDSFETEIPRFN